MHYCPRCKDPNFVWIGTCPKCGFDGDPNQIEELSQLEWLLGEMKAWIERGLLEEIPIRLQEYYLDRYHNLQGDLGLQYEPFTDEEAQQAWPELRQLEILFAEIDAWLRGGQLKSGYLPERYARLLELRARIGERTGDLRPETTEQHLEDLDFLEQAVADLKRRDDFTSPEARWEILTALAKEKVELETSLQPPAKVTEEAPPTPAEEPPAPEPAPVIVPPPPPRPPFRERLWRSILSERTLQALLFLGIFLLFGAAISFVVWGWKDFSAPVRVAVPFGFTALFFGLGHLVRTRTHLDRSALALSAIAALLIPIDSYTIYANYGSPPRGWPEFWLVTSVACLVAYVLAALQIQSRFFGYITGVAAGSTILAMLEAGTHISRDWYSAAISVLAVAMILLGTRILSLPHPGRWRVFADPFRYLALWIPAVLMPLTLGLRLATRSGFDALHYAMTVNWFLGGFIFAWGAIHHRSRSLGMLAAVALPVSVYMAQGAIFDVTGTNPAWQAFGLACLTPLYLYAGKRLSMRSDDEVLSAHGRTATRWGVVLVLISAFFALTDLTSGTAAAATHAVLVFTTALAAILWQKPRTLLAASFFSFTAMTFAMTELDLSLGQLGVGWVSLAILHLLLVLRLARSGVEGRVPYLRQLVIAGYLIAALALLPPILLYDGKLLSYALGNWVVLSAWGALLAYRGQPGFLPLSKIEGKRSLFDRLLERGAIYHWFSAVALPLWIWIVTRNNQAPDFVLPAALAALAWVMVLLSHRLNRLGSEFRVPWRLVGLFASVLSQVLAFLNAPDHYTPSIILLAIGALYFTDTFLIHEGTGFVASGLVSAWGVWLLLERANANEELITFILCLLVALYILSGLELERRKRSGLSYSFFAPLYLTAHLIAVLALIRIYLHPLDELLGGPAWSDAMQLWGAADQLVLALVYAAFAWGRYQEFWGHLAAWLAMIGGGFVAIVYSHGHGSLAAKGAVIAAVMVLAERALFSWKRRSTWRARRRAVVRLAWRLYRRPLLVAGWTASVGIILLSLVRNLIWLGGGRIQQIWAAAGLSIIVALYASSAFLFRKARFVWFAVLVLFAPWTILTNLGWLTSYKPSLPEFAISWTVLAWLLFILFLWLEKRIPQSYLLPLQTATQLLLPFSMLWAVADTQSSLYTVGLSISLYAVLAWRNHRRAQVEDLAALAATKFLYPALGLIPLWSVYWLDSLVPAARHEDFGILLLAFAVLGLLAGTRLERIAPRPGLKRAYSLPAYLTAYVTLILGTLMVAHRPDLLPLALLYAAVVMLVSTWLFRNALWLYPMSVLLGLSLLSALSKAEIPVERRGWWLIGLAGLHLLSAWLLRRNGNLNYAAPLLATGFAWIAFGLPASSLDQVGAIWGYGAAAALYALSAFWLRQPILLLPACGLVAVPYANLLARSAIPVEYYGLSLFPGALVAFFLGRVLDQRLGEWRDFPWNRPSCWLQELARRLLGWWGLSLYALGLAFASAAPFFAADHADLISLSFLLLAVFYGWAVFRFRLRLWLVLAILATHYAVAYYLDFLRLWRTTDQAWLRFLPLTALLLAAGLWLEKRLAEKPPTTLRRLYYGWSRPFYLFVLLDMFFSELGSLRLSLAGAEISLFNAILMAVLASFWQVQGLAYFTSGLGMLALLQWHGANGLSGFSLTPRLAWLALGYGAIGFGYSLVSPRKHPRESSWHSIWALPLQRSAMWISALTLLLTFLLGFDIFGWTVRALFGLSFRQIVHIETVLMIIRVLSLVGLLYVAAAAVHKRIRFGYLAVGMLLTSWFLYAFYVSAWDDLRQMQWYAIPAGLYLLSIAYIEWQRGHRILARWIDYASILLMLGSLFWQTLIFGWQFAVLLSAEGLIAFWWGSARRLRRFFYAGMAGVILATLGQLLNALQEVNQWITFGLMGLLLVLVAIVVERRLEAIKAWQQVLETWE